MRFADLTREERAEIDALVHQCYVTESGSYRSHAAAAQEFDQLLASAVQARKSWAGVLLDDFRWQGEKRFVQDRHRNSGMFEFVHRGRTRSRSINRGAKRADESGRMVWTQPSLMEWTADDLREAIADAARQIEEHQANVALYRDMLAVLDQTGAATFELALAKVGKTWDEWLGARGVA